MAPAPVPPHVAPVPPHVAPIPPQVNFSHHEGSVKYPPLNKNTEQEDLVQLTLIDSH